MGWRRGWGGGWGGGYAAPYAAPGAYAAPYGAYAPPSVPYAAPYGAQGPWGAPSPEQELETLHGQADWLKEQMDAISKRIQDLEEDKEE